MYCYCATYEPSLLSPAPPGQALTNFGSASSETGFMPVGKYGPTGDAMTYSKASDELATPRVGWNRVLIIVSWSFCYKIMLETHCPMFEESWSIQAWAALLYNKRDALWIKLLVIIEMLMRSYYRWLCRTKRYRNALSSASHDSKWEQICRHIEMRNTIFPRT